MTRVRHGAAFWLCVTVMLYTMLAGSTQAIAAPTVACQTAQTRSVYYDADPQAAIVMSYATMGRSIGHTWHTRSHETRSQTAIDEGGLVEYLPDYYVAHNYEPYGKAIERLQAGDVITLDGSRIRIEGQTHARHTIDRISDIKKSAAGNDAVYFQTCVTGTDDEIVIWYGTYLDEPAGKEASRWENTATNE